MRPYLPFIIIGLTTGAIYGLSAIGFVLTYRTSGIFNFAHGALAAAAVFVFYSLRVDHHQSWPVAFVISVFVLGPIMGLVMELIARRLALTTVALRVVGTVGIILVITGLASLKYDQGNVFPRYLGDSRAFRIFGVSVQWNQVIIFLIGAGVSALLFLFLRVTRIGKAMRAVVDDPDLLDLTGISPARVRRVSWVIGCTLAALSGVLVAQGGGLDGTFITFLILSGLGAAALGFFANLPLSYVGGAIIGVGGAIMLKIASRHPILQTVPISLPYLVLLLAPIIMARRRLVAVGESVRRRLTPWRAPTRVRIVAAVVITTAFALVPTFAGTRLSSYSDGLTKMILLLSLGLLVRAAGQVSLCQYAFAAIGAATFSQFRVDHGWPWLLALLVAALIVVPIGALIAIPSSRLPGVFLALTTLGFGIVVSRMFYSTTIMFGATADGREMPRPSFADTDTKYYVLLLVVVILTALAMTAIHEGRLGRMLRGMADSPVALQTLGLSVNTTRVIVFSISSFFAAIAGVLYGCLVTRTSSATFPPEASLLLIAVLSLAPFVEPWYAVLASVGIVIPTFFSDNTGHIALWLQVVFGTFAVLIAIQGGTRPAPQVVQRLFERFRRPRTLVTSERADTGESVSRQLASAPMGLEVRGLRVNFGAVSAVNDVSLQAPVGQITGLIGPNGAGKTTTFNCCTGLQRPTAGRILLHERDVTDVAPHIRSRLGLGRTFQTMRLFDTLSVAENVTLGREAGLARRSLRRHLMSSRDQSKLVRSAAAEALELCGIAHLENANVGELSTGQRRLVELARCLAGSFDVLLLDEPSSGLDRDETQRFGRILQDVVAQRGIGILLVEHDMELVMRVCSYVYVLDFGTMLFEGTPEAVTTSDVVRDAYLGSESHVPPATVELGASAGRGAQ
jgi:ABC-type branched-subunit amino acid transport system ATPase component/branched-subunit amino acid ABC-type transport system permease component